MKASGPRFFARLVALSVLMAGCAYVPSPAPIPEMEAYGFRDPGEGFATTLSSKDRKKLDEGMRYLWTKDLARADAVFRSVKKPPFEVGLAYLALARDQREPARGALDALQKAWPRSVAIAEALADLDAVEQRLREAYGGYRAALRLAPRDPRLTRRVAETRGELVARRSGEGEQALAAKDLDGARRVGLSLLELDPASPAGFRILADAAEAGGKHEDAYAWALKARGLDPTSRDDTRRVAELAMKTGRYGEAMTLFAELAKDDPSFNRRAEEARLEFKIQNLPETARRAAQSPRLTRAQAASLLWALVPEVREAVPTSASEVAVDAVGRPDRTALVRAIGLGFFAVSKETHRVGADSAVPRSELPALLGRLASLVSAGRAVPECLGGEVSLPGLAECGILPETSSRTATGKEAVQAIEGTARAARRGGTR